MIGNGEKEGIGLSQTPYPENKKLDKMVAAYLKKVKERKAEARREFQWFDFLERKRKEERRTRANLQFPDDDK